MGEFVNTRLRAALVHYQDDAATGGALRVGEALARNLDRSRVEPHLVFAYGNEGTISRAFDGKINCIKANGPTDPSAWIRARSYFKRLSPDVVHFVDPVNWIRAALTGTSSKKIMHVHGKFLPDYLTFKTRFINHFAVGGADARICITNGTRRSLEALRWNGDGNTFVVHNAIDCAHFSPETDKSSARSLLGLPQDALIMGMSCRVVKYRGIQDALRLLTMLSPRWHLLVCGDGPYRPNLEALARDLGVTDRTHFAGLLEDVRPGYASMDIYLLLARYDPFGLATAEAMSCGIPVLGLEGEGEYREPEYPLVTDENAILIPRTRKWDLESEEPTEVIEALALKVKVLEKDGDAFHTMREKARSWVISRFDVKRQADMVADIYEAVTRR